MLGVIAYNGSTLRAIGIEYLSGEGPRSGVEHAEVAAAVNLALARMAINPLDIRLVLIDEGSYMNKAYDEILVSLWVNSIRVFCWAHKLHGVGGLVRKVSEFADDLETVLQSQHLSTVSYGRHGGDGGESTNRLV